MSSKAPIRSETVVVVDDNVRFLDAARRQLMNGGFTDVNLAVDPGTAFTLVECCNPEVLLIDIDLASVDLDGLELLGKVRSNGYRGIAVVVSGDRSPEQFFSAARAGADDFLVKGPHVSLPGEIIRMIDGNRGRRAPRARRSLVMDLGYLRSFGLTPREIEVLGEWATDFPRLQILSDRIGQATVQTRKLFSRVYKKIGIDNPAQLAHVLSVCALFERDN